MVRVKWLMGDEGCLQAAQGPQRLVNNEYNPSAVSAMTHCLLPVLTTCCRGQRGTGSLLNLGCKAKKRKNSCVLSSHCCLVTPHPTEYRRYQQQLLVEAAWARRTNGVLLCFLAMEDLDPQVVFLGFPSRNQESRKVIVDMKLSRPVSRSFCQQVPRASLSGWDRALGPCPTHPAAACGSSTGTA